MLALVVACCCWAFESRAGDRMRIVERVIDGDTIEVDGGARFD